MRFLLFHHVLLLKFEALVPVEEAACVGSLGRWSLLLRLIVDVYILGLCSLIDHEFDFTTFGRGWLALKRRLSEELWRCLEIRLVLLHIALRNNLGALTNLGGCLICLNNALGVLTGLMVIC